MGSIVLAQNCDFYYGHGLVIKNNREIRKHAVLNDVKIYELANAILEDYLKDEAQVKRLIRKLRI